MSASAGLRRSIASLFTLQAAAYAIPLIMAPYLVRVLGPDQYGRTAFAMAVVQYLVVLADYGFNISATRQAALLRDDPQGLSRLVATVMVVKLGLAAAGLLILLALLAIVPALEGNVRLYVLCYLAVVGHAVFPVWLLQGIDRMGVITRCTIAAQLMVLAGVFIWVREPSDYRLAAGLQSGASLVAGGLSWLFLRDLLRQSLKWPERRFLRDVVGQGWHVFVSTVAINLYTATSTVVLGLLVTPASLGYFAAADRLVKALQGLTSPISQAVFPHVARIALHSRQEALVFLRKLLQWQGLATLTISLLLWLAADPLVDLLFGPSFGPSKPLLRWMAFIPFLVGLSNVFGMQTMLNFGMNRLFSHVVLGSCLVNLVLLWLLFVNFGLAGAAMSLLATEAAVTVAMALILSRTGILPALLRRQNA